VQAALACLALQSQVALGPRTTWWDDSVHVRVVCKFLLLMKPMRRTGNECTRGCGSDAVMIARGSDRAIPFENSLLDHCGYDCMH
ncbi:unnamed protein product, partial [Sphacelaria rigidula]